MSYIFLEFVFVTLVSFQATAQSLVFALLLVSAICCSGYQVATILQKHKQHIVYQ